MSGQTGVKTTGRLVIIGLDCAEPSLVFDAWRTDLPNLRRLMESGVWGRLESCHPPITVPAWSCMMSGRDPGELGIYGFRNRIDRSYERMAIATSQQVFVERIWQTLSSAGKRCAVLGVPGTYPPSPLNGVMVSCFLTPGNDSSYTHPADLKAEVERVSDGYLIDVPEFRTEDKARLLRDVRAMTAKRFRVARHLLARERWDFFVMVEMGIDRIHHGFWRFFDRRHRLFEPGNPFEHAVHEYYIEVDAEIGRTLEACGDASILVVSDHGARRMEGGVRINEWLLREGYLRLLVPPAPSAPLRSENVDWPATRAWGEGGYYGRIFLNIEGREPQGCVPPAERESLLNEISTRLEAMEDHQGRSMGTKVLRPDTLYRAVRGIPPDLLVYFGNLAWRSVGTFGGGEVLTFANDTGPDDANHAQDGLFIFNGPEVPDSERGKERGGMSLYDVAPTIRRLFRLPIPPDLRGRALL